MWWRPASGASVDLAQVLTLLGKSGINEVLVEAGATLAGALVEQQCVDELLLYNRPGGPGRSRPRAAAVAGAASLGQARRFEVFETLALGADQRYPTQIMFTGIIQDTGTVAALTPRGGDVRLAIRVGRLDLSKDSHR